MSKIAAKPSDWDDQLSETFSDAFSDAFQVPLRQVTKNVLRFSGGSSSKIPPPGFFGCADSNGGEKKGDDDHDQLLMEHFDGWTQGTNSAGNLKQPNEQKTSSFLSTPSVPMVEQVDSITMSYSSSSDTTNGREARDDMAEEGTVSSDDTCTAVPTAAASTKMGVKAEPVYDETTALTVAGGVGTLSARKKRHQKYKLRVTEFHAKKEEEEEEQPKSNNSALVAHNVETVKRNKVSERLAKSRERFNNRHRGNGGGGGGERESTTRDSVASLLPPPPPLTPPPPPRHYLTITATSKKEKEDDIALAMEKIESIVERRTSKHQKSAALSTAASTDSHEELTLLMDELENLKAQIDAEVEESNDMMMVLEANLDAAKIENDSLLQHIDELNLELTFSKAEKKCLADKMEELIEKLTTVQAEKSTLQYTADGVNTANQKLALSAAELKLRTISLEEEVVKLEEATRDVETQLRKKEMDLLQLEDSAQTFNNELQSKNSEIEELMKESCDLREQIHSLQGSVFILQECVAAKEKAVEEADAYSSALKEEVSCSTTQLTKLAKESEELLKFKADAEVRIDLLRHTMTEYSHQVIDLEAKLEESQVARACLEDEKTNLKESNTNLVKSLAKVSAENEKKDATIEDMSNQVDAAIKAAIDRSGDLESQIAILQRQLHDSTMKSARLEEENRDMKNRLDAAEENAERLTQENTESDILVNDLESRMLDMIVERREMMSSMKEMQSKVDAVMKERDSARSTVLELMSGNEKKVEILETLQLEKVEVLTKLEEAEEKLKICDSEKNDYLNASALANREREREAAKYSTEISAMLAKTLQLEGDVESLTTNLTLSKSELEETKSKLESALARSKMLELEYRTTLGMLEVTKGEKDKVATDLLEALNGVIASSNDKDRESAARLIALTTEKDDLVKKVSKMNSELNEMHALVKTLKAEKNAALAKVNDIVLSNTTVLESKVKAVTCRLDSEFGEFQQELDKLNAEIIDLQGQNWRLNRENTQLHSDKKKLEARATTLDEAKASLEETNYQLKIGKAKAETREASLKETRQTLEVIKAVKHVSWSSYASAAQIKSNALSKEIASQLDTASSCTGSSFVDPDIAEQVNKALERARQRRNVPKA